MAKLRFAEGMKVYPMIAPVAGTTTAVESVYVDAADYNWMSFLVNFGVLTSDSTDIITVTVECSTAASSNATEVTIPFTYRKTSAVGTDTIGAISTASTSGVTVTAAEDAIALLIEVDPCALGAELTDGRYLRLVVTPTAEMGAFVICANFLGEPKYQRNSIPSCT